MRIVRVITVRIAVIQGVGLSILSLRCWRILIGCLLGGRGQLRLLLLELLLIADIGPRRKNKIDLNTQSLYKQTDRKNRIKRAGLT